MAEKLGALLVGAGGMGRAWAQNLQDCEEVRLAGWLDIRPGIAGEAATELGIPGVYTGKNLEPALEHLRPDFLVNVTTPDAHHEITLVALETGVPVLSEKPLADSLERARDLVAASERTGKLLMVSQNMRYHPGLRAFRSLISERVGALGILDSGFYIGAHFGGFREEMESPLLLDMAIHTFDAARYLSGADPVSVYCEEFNPPWSWYAGDAAATAVFEMTGGLRYTYRGSWCSEGCHTPWECEWRAVGPNGTATWDGQNIPVAEVVAERGGFFSRTEKYAGEIKAGEPEEIAGSLRDFLHALKTGATPMGECHDNIKSLAMVFAAIESAKTGRKVAVPQMMPEPGI